MRSPFIKEAAVIFILTAVFAILYNSFAANGLDIIYKPLQITPGSALNIHDFNRIRKQLSVILVDARSKEDFQNGHIPNALNLPLNSPRSTKTQFLSKFPKETLFVLYCINAECTQAERLERQFNLLGFTNTHVFTGGWQAWQEAGQDAQ